MTTTVAHPIAGSSPEGEHLSEQALLEPVHLHIAVTPTAVYPDLVDADRIRPQIRIPMRQETPAAGFAYHPMITRLVEMDEPCCPW